MAEKEKEEFQYIARNKKAFFNYEIVEKMEAGIVLQGSEVKSIRNGKVAIHEAYARVKNGEVWVIGMDVSLYPQAGPHNNHEPRAMRKLLLHRQEINRLERFTQEQGRTLVPMKLYWKKGQAKLLIGLGVGKAQHDKRAAMAERDAKRQVQRALRERQKV